MAGAEVHVPHRWKKEKAHEGGAVLRVEALGDLARECLAIEVDTSIPGLRAARVLERIAEARPLPKTLVCDNGPEFTGRDFDSWAFRRGAHIHFIRPRKPVENVYVESFNRLRPYGSPHREPGVAVRPGDTHAGAEPHPVSVRRPEGRTRPVHNRVRSVGHRLACRLRGPAAERGLLVLPSAASLGASRPRGAGARIPRAPFLWV